MTTRQNDINVFLPKNISTMAISHILQHHRRRLHKRRLFLEELGKALLQPEMMWRKTLPRTAAAKSAVERMRKDAEQPSTSGIIHTDTGGKKRARCQLCVSSDNKTS
ncbi:Trem-like transcript 1 protein, partial [Trichinella spiralis]